MSRPAPRFREFALAVYEEDGVSAATLVVQGRCDVDVNVLLLAAYVGAVRGCAFLDDDLHAAQHRVGGWQRDVVIPLRTVRSRLKGGPQLAASPHTAELRAGVKALELDAEMIELAELEAFLIDRDFPGSPVAPVAAAVAAMTTVTRGDRAVDVQDAISVIATAAAEYGGER